MSIDHAESAFPKPKDRERRVTLSRTERRDLLNALYSRQDARCAVCGVRMTREYGEMRCATLGHRRPEPMGAKKRDNPDNIIGAICWCCNFQQGSRRV